MKKNRKIKSGLNNIQIGLNVIPNSIISLEDFLQSDIAADTFKKLKTQEFATGDKLVALLAVYQMVSTKAQFISDGFEEHLSHPAVEDLLIKATTQLVVENLIQIATAIGNDRINHIWGILVAGGPAVYHLDEKSEKND